MKTGRNHTKPAHVESRRDFYDWLAKTIRIDGIDKVERDTAFDNKTLIQRRHPALLQERHRTPSKVLSEGVLLEAGFDDVTPEHARRTSAPGPTTTLPTRCDIIDNRAKGVACYDPGYTFVEKLQTVSTKFRQQQETKEFPIDFMRHYYDVYSLLQRPEVQAFIGTDAYKAHKAKRFRPGDNPNIAENQAFVLGDPEARKLYEQAYDASKALYYGDKPNYRRRAASARSPRVATARRRDRAAPRRRRPSR